MSSRRDLYRNRRAPAYKMRRVGVGVGARVAGMTDIATANNPEASRYEARIDGDLAGYAEYLLRDGQIVFTHTEVADAFEGRGVGSVLVRAALDDVRETGGRSVVPRCPFVRSWIEKHPDYEPLVAG
jgi:predicted GNAT family acetyltransferase